MRITVCLIPVVKLKTVAKKLINKFKKDGLRKKKPAKTFKQSTVIATEGRRCKTTMHENSAKLKIRIGGEALTLDSEQISRLAY